MTEPVKLLVEYLKSTAKKLANQLDFAVPYPRLGVLTPFPGSIVPKSISLYERKLSYGRDPTSRVRFPNHKDIRVPLRAIRISWWCPGILQKIEQGTDWRKIPGLVPLVQTRTKKPIWINGVELTMGTDCWNYGILHTGDVISVFEPEVKGAQGRKGEFLVFRCEFFIGPNATPREKPFVIKKQEKTFLKKKKFELTLCTFIA